MVRDDVGRAAERRRPLQELGKPRGHKVAVRRDQPRPHRAAAARLPALGPHLLDERGEAAEVVRVLLGTEVCLDPARVEAWWLKVGASSSSERPQASS